MAEYTFREVIAQAMSDITVHIRHQKVCWLSLVQKE